MKLSTEDRDYLILGSLGEICGSCEEEGEEYDAESELTRLKDMTDEQLLNEAMIDWSEDITPRDYYSHWSNYIPNEWNYLEN